MSNDRNIPIEPKMSVQTRKAGKSMPVLKCIYKLIIVCTPVFLNNLSARTLKQQEKQPCEVVMQTEVRNDSKLIAEKNDFTQNTDTLPYRLIRPENENPTQKYPLLIYLHGGGSRGTDNEKPLREFSPYFNDPVTGKNKFPCYILVPQCAKSDAWVIFPDFPKSLSVTPEATPSARVVLALIRQLTETKNIDSNRIYLTGFSLGGEGTFDLISRAPDLFACAVPLASVADTSKAGIIKDIPLWAFHGSADQINDVKYTRLMIDAIIRQGGHPKYTELDAVRHDCRKEAYQNDALWKWIFEQRRNRVSTDASGIEGLHRTLKPMRGLEIYDSLFGTRQTDCVQVLNYQDQMNSHSNRTVWLYVETCPQEAEQMLAKYPFRPGELLSSKDWDGKVPGGESLEWFNPAALGTAIEVYEFSTNDSKDILTIWSNRDKTSVFIRSIHEKY